MNVALWTCPECGMSQSNPEHGPNTLCPWGYDAAVAMGWAEGRLRPVISCPSPESVWIAEQAEARRLEDASPPARRDG
jgi:hypothetical protein